MRLKTLLIGAAVVALASFILLHYRKPEVPAAVSAPTDEAASLESAKSSTPVFQSAQFSSRRFSSRKESAEEMAQRLVSDIERLLNSTHAADHEMVFTNLLPMLMDIDPSAAAKWWETREPGLEREELLRRIAEGWSDKDLTGALAWGTNLINESERALALTTVCRQLAGSNPAEAIALAQRLELSAGGVIQNLAQLWAEKDLPAALEWARRQPADQREEMLARVAFVQAQADPIAAGNMIIQQMTPGPAQNEAVMTVLHQWALRDIGAAQAWVEQFPDSPLRERARAELVGIARYQSGHDAP